MKTTKAYSLDVEVVEAVNKVVESGRYKNASVFVQRCIQEHFESEFPDLEGEEALKMAEKLEQAARSYREMAKPKTPELVEEPAALTAQEEEIFKASEAGAANE